MKQILIFVLFSAIICWLMFAPIYKHVLIVRQAVLQKEIDYLLEVGANGSHGYINEAMIEQSKQRLIAKGLDAEKLVYIVSSTSGLDASNPESPIVRGDGIELQINYPLGNLLEIDRLIGIDPPSPSTLLSAYGIKMSEYVPLSIDSGFYPEPNL